MVASNRKNLPLVKYTSRDFESIKQDLNDYRRRYYPNISRDENEASFDEMMLDTVAYVGDILSFYLDYSVNESFLDTAVEFNNVLRHGKPLGFKFKGNPSSVGIETFFVIIPANSTGLGPNPNYIPILKKDSELTSLSGNGFILNEDVNFSKSTNQIVVARVDETNGTPTAYAIKAFGRIISGQYSQEIIEVGDFQRFLRIQLSGANISEIISVIDDEGNEYFEVDYLSQDTIYKSITNNNTDIDNAPNILRPFVVPRRFVTERDRTTTYLQFGFGSENDVTSDPLIDPSQIILDIHGKNYVTDVSFDPSNLLGTNKLGIVPANTKLRITYRVNSTDNVNASANSITKVSNPIVEFSNINSLDPQTMRAIIDSIESTNEKSITGDVTVPTVTELKFRIFDRFGAQNRAVTLPDYRSLIYSMPPQFGAIKRINVVQDHDSFKRNLNMYVISEDSDGSLIETSQTIKENLVVWLNQGKMINDTIDILDAKIINLGIEYVVLGEKETNKFDILNNIQEIIKTNYSKKEEIGSQFSISKFSSILSKAEGVVDVLKLKVFQKKGSQYSNTVVDLNSLISSDGRFIHTPENVIFEIKFLGSDIKGSVK